jgi:DNA-directed RNA polymerase subunit L/DNA-directed RNA polymerase alpha subunit
MSKYISNISVNEKNPLHISFDISNVNLALVNALRRTFLAEIPIITIDRKSIIYQKNDTIFDNDFITKRLTLLVFDQNMIYDAIGEEKIDKISISLDVYNDTEELMTVYADDLNIKTGPTTEINILSDEFKQMILTKLKPKQTLQFTAKFILSTHKDSGATFDAVCWSAHSFKQDEKLIDEKMNEANINTEKEKKIFMMEEAEKYYLKDKNGDPQTCIFNLESCGHYRPDQIVGIGFDTLINKLKIVKTLIQNVDKYDDNLNMLVGSEYIEINPIENAGFEYTFFNEDHTLGNLLQSYLNDDSSINMAGYNIPHPLKKELRVRVVTEQKQSDKEHNKSVMNSVIDKLIILIGDVKKDFK